MTRQRWLTATALVAGGLLGLGCVGGRGSERIQWSERAAGAWHTCGLSTDGSIYCWGQNAYGQLGDGTTTESTSPTPVAHGALRFIAVTVGGNLADGVNDRAHTCAVTTLALYGGGDAYCWGYVGAHQVGVPALGGTKTPPAAHTPAQVEDDSFVGFRGLITAGALHTCANGPGGADSGVVCWGGNGAGQLGDGTTISRAVPAPLSFDRPPVRRNLPNPAFHTNPRSMGAGDLHTCMIAAEWMPGFAFCWGSNASGQLGDGTTTDRLVPVHVASSVALRGVDAGAFHTCALDADGVAYCWGNNVSGQLGAISKDRCDPLTPSSACSKTPVRVPGEIRFQQLSAGARHTCGVTGATARVGTIYCWGDNTSGQLGNGSNTPSLSPVQVAEPAHEAVRWRSVTAGDAHTCAVTTRGRAYCWGSNIKGQLGTGSKGEAFSSNIPVPVAGPP